MGQVGYKEKKPQSALLLLTECNTALSKYLVSIQGLLMQYVQQVAL